MSARSDSVCKYICEAGDWRLTNLQLQKLLYMSQMAYYGLHNDRLTDLNFEAWEYGPVAPRVYRQVRMFGASPIRDVFTEALPFASGSARLEVLQDVCRDLLPFPPGDLVEITHWGGGAWAKYYEPGVKGIRIPDHALAEEFAARVKDGQIKPS